MEVGTSGVCWRVKPDIWELLRPRVLEYPLEHVLSNHIMKKGDGEEDEDALKDFPKFWFKGNIPTFATPPVTSDRGKAANKLSRINKSVTKKGTLKTKIDDVGGANHLLDISNSKPIDGTTTSKKRAKAPSPCLSSSSHDSSNQGDTRKPSSKRRTKVSKTDKSTKSSSIKNLDRKPSAKELASFKSANQSSSTVVASSKTSVSKARNILPMTAGAKGSATLCPEVGGRKSEPKNLYCLKEGCGRPLGRGFFQNLLYVMLIESNV